MKRLFVLFTTLVIAFASPATAFANQNNLDLFKRLIDVKRDDSGKLTELSLKSKPSLAAMSSTATVAEALIQDLSQIDYSMKLSASDKENLAQDGWTKADVENFEKAKNKLKAKKELISFLSDKGLSDILREFEKDLNVIFQFNVLAKPNDAGYFHERSLINKAIKKAMSLAENAMGDVPALRVVFFLLNETIGMVEGKRAYLQYAVLHYLETVSPSELGFTANEVALIKSSIYASRIGWTDFKKLKDAKKNWPTYGTKLFAKQTAENAKRLAKYGPKIGEVGASYDFAFAPIRANDIGYIVNSENQKFKFSKNVSMAYDTSDTNQIRNFRVSMRLAQLAATFLPIPGFALKQLQSLLSSYYSGQRITEGALFAALSSKGLDAEANVVLQQSINPFLIWGLE